MDQQRVGYTEATNVLGNTGNGSFLLVIHNALDLAVGLARSVVHTSPQKKGKRKDILDTFHFAGSNSSHLDPRRAQTPRARLRQAVTDLRDVTSRRKRGGGGTATRRPNHARENSAFFRGVRARSSGQTRRVFFFFICLYAPSPLTRSINWSTERGILFGDCRARKVSHLVLIGPRRSRTPQRQETKRPG